MRTVKALFGFLALIIATLSFCVFFDNRSLIQQLLLASSGAVASLALLVVLKALK